MHQKLCFQSTTVLFVVLLVLELRRAPTPRLFLEGSGMAPPLSCRGDPSCSGFLGRTTARSSRTTPALCRLACENDALFPVKPQQELEQHPPSLASKELRSDKNRQRCHQVQSRHAAQGEQANTTGEPPRSKFLKGDAKAHSCFTLNPPNTAPHSAAHWKGLHQGDSSGNAHGGRQRAPHSPCGHSRALSWGFRGNPTGTTFGSGCRHKFQRSTPFIKALFTGNPDIIPPPQAESRAIISYQNTRLLPFPLSTSFRFAFEVALAGLRPPWNTQAQRHSEKPRPRGRYAAPST